MKTILVGFRLFVTLIIIKFKKSFYFLRGSKTSTKKLITGYLPLLLFVDEMKRIAQFATTQEQQKELIYLFFQISVLAEENFDAENDNGSLTAEDLSAVFQEDNMGKNSLIKKLREIVCHIRKIHSNGHNFDKFKLNILKTWGTQKGRDSKKTKVTCEEALELAENRGASYFLALVYLLNPINLNEALERAIYSSGAWFQVLDDCDDRGKDNGVRSTPFTICLEAPQKIRRRCIKKYEKLIYDVDIRTSHLIKFLRGVSGLVSIKSAILGKKFDWHD